MLELKVVLVASAAVCLAACGTVAEGPTVDGGDTDARHGIRPPGVDGEVGSHDAGPGAHDARRDSTSRTDAGVTFVDAGEYHGDGSFFVDGGAYADAVTGSDATSSSLTDAAGNADASLGCSALSACCGSLPTAYQSLCTTIAGQGNAATCATELTELQGADNCNGVSVLASDVQVPPNFLVSDGTTLFWTSGMTPGLAAVPVRGGAVTTLLAGPISNDQFIFDYTLFLAVDVGTVYVVQDDAILRIPKSGAAPTLVNESGAQVIAVTRLGPVAYWTENVPGANFGASDQPVALRSAALLGGPHRSDLISTRN
jgi:hypothetical protein